MKPDWTTIKSEYVETSVTLAEVQAKYDVPRGTLSARATREKWHDDKQQFAAKVEQERRDKMIAKRAAEQEQFESNVIRIVNGQLAIIVREMSIDGVDAAKVLKLANALEKVQRIGGTAFGRAA